MAELIRVFPRESVPRPPLCPALCPAPPSILPRQPPSPGSPLPLLAGAGARLPKSSSATSLDEGLTPACPQAHVPAVGAGTRVPTSAQPGTSKPPKVQEIGGPGAVTMVFWCPERGVMSRVFLSLGEGTEAQRGCNYTRGHTAPPRRQPTPSPTASRCCWKLLAAQQPHRMVRLGSARH